MKYLITGVDGKLSGRVAETMLNTVSPEQLIFTCPICPEYQRRKKLFGSLKGLH